MKKAVILQPGKLGDLIVTKPIADYYNNLGYHIEWLVFDTFRSFFNNFDNVTPINFDLDFDKEEYFKQGNKRLNFSKEKNFLPTILFFNTAYQYLLDRKPDLVLNICWGFPGSSSKNNDLIKKFHVENRNWIDMRYSLANVPLKERWNFRWIRNEKKEDELLKAIENHVYKKYGSKNYSILHNYDGNKNTIDLPNKINFSYVNGYEMLDWYKVILNATEIACVDSSLCNLVEVLPELKDKKKTYLGSEEPHYFHYMRNILLNNWIDMDGKHIISDYKDKL